MFINIFTITNKFIKQKVKLFLYVQLNILMIKNLKKYQNFIYQKIFWLASNWNDNKCFLELFWWIQKHINIKWNVTYNFYFYFLMEIEIKGNLRIKIDQISNTASIIRSPKAVGHVFIPHFAKYKNKKLKNNLNRWICFWQL